MTDEQLKQLKERVHELYGRQNLYDQCQVFIDKTPKTLRHEDSVLGGSGTWVDVSVFVPDNDEKHSA